jgi:hypothetical protein
MKTMEYWNSHGIIECDNPKVLLDQLQTIKSLEDGRSVQLLVATGDKLLVDEIDSYVEELRLHLPGRSILFVLQFSIYSELAQQKLLKALEESANHIHVLIIHNSSSVLLSTVCSRCRRYPSFVVVKNSKKLTNYQYDGVNPGFVLRFQRILSVQNNLPKTWISELEKFIKKSKKN